MSVVIILLLPLIAAVLVCIPVQKLLGVGRDRRVLRCHFDFGHANRARVAAGNSVVSTLKLGMDYKWIAVDGLSALILLLIALSQPPRRFTPSVTWRMKI
jgi:hypothetical protein